MTDSNNLTTPLFLSDKEVRKIIEMMFFSYRDFISGPDEILENIKFGRAHHRIIYFVGKRSEITIKDLLSILQITKQSLSRVLNQLVRQKYVMLAVGKDKRSKKLSLTIKGKKLEKKLSDIQISKIKKIIKNFNENDINSFKLILYKMIDEKNRIKFDDLNR